MSTHGYDAAADLNRCHKCGSDDVHIAWITVNDVPSIPSADCAACGFYIESLASYPTEDELITAVTAAWNERNPMPYTITPEEKARREAIAAAKARIKELAAKRQLILKVYRMPHGTPEHKQAMADARKTLGLTSDWMSDKWHAHAIPGRFDWRGDTHAAHLKLAELTGKPHVREVLPAAV